jgi:hypothetical protein
VIDAVALAGHGFEAFAIDDRELSVMIWDQPERWRSPAVLVTPARRTPSIEARNSCVRGILSD